MFLSHSLYYQLSAEQSMEEKLGAVMKVLRAHGLADTPLRVHCTEQVERKTSILAKSTKKIPELQPLVNQHAKPCRLSNLGAFWHEGGETSSQSNISWDTACALAGSIPRSFPLAAAHFCFASLSLLSLDTLMRQPIDRPKIGSSVGAKLPAGVFFTQSKHGRKCKQTLIATIHQAVPPHDVRQIPGFPQAVQDFLQSLGTIHKTETRLWFFPAEYAKLQQKSAAARKIPVPNILVPETVPDDHDWEGAGSLKAAICKALQPLGFHYQSHLSGEGTGVLRWRTPLHHDAMLLYDWGPRSREVYAQLYLCGAGFQEVAEMSLGGPDTWAPRVDCPAAVDAVANNIAYCVAELQKNWVPKIAAIFGPSPEWYSTNRSLDAIANQFLW